jgi:hypothetical protein
MHIKELTFNSFNDIFYKRPVSAETCPTEVHYNIGYHLPFISVSNDIVTWREGGAARDL